MASVKGSCGPCSRMNKSSTAIKYCSDCDDQLCNDCATAHKAIKITTAHHVTDISYLEDTRFHVTKTCHDHVDMELEFFCSDHDNLCCRTCTVNTHRNCGKILPIDVASNEVKESTMYNDIVSSYRSLSKTTNQMIDNRKQNKEDLTNGEDKLKKKLAEYKRRLDARFREFEKKCLSDHNKTRTDLLITVESELKCVTKKKESMKAVLEQLEFLSKNGSNKQIYLLLNTMKFALPSHVHDTKKMTDELKDYRVTINASNDVGIDFQSCFTFNVESKQCDTNWQFPLQQQAQVLSDKGKAPTKFELEQSFPVTGCITCMVTTDNDVLILCNADNNAEAISSWTTEGKHLKSCRFESRVWGVAVTKNPNQAVVTLPDLMHIQ